MMESVVGGQPQSSQYPLSLLFYVGSSKNQDGTTDHNRRYNNREKAHIIIRITPIYTRTRTESMLENGIDRLDAGLPHTINLLEPLLPATYNKVMGDKC